MSRPLEILLVEDNEGDVEITLNALSDWSPECNVTVANDGLEALAILRNEKCGNHASPPQIILLDLNMPRMGGLEFLKEIKADAKLRCIPVIILTSSQSHTDIHEGYQGHASCYVVKPFDGRAFTSAVQEIVRFWGKLSRLPA